ncbi:MAG: Crp/Fnr family transcriptional regulator [Bacteroidota bacterium]
MADRSKLWYLENFNLLEGLSKDEMMHIHDTTVMMNAKKGQYIYFPEDPSRSLFFLKEGRIKIGNTSEDGRENILTILQPGEVFGELALTGEGQREDYAQAMDEGVVICAMGIDDMETLMERSTKMGLRLTKLIGFRMRKIERKLKALIFKDARTRIIDFIREMAEEIGRPAGDEVLIRHSLTHQEIANLTASSRQTVTTVLNELRADNIINFERKRIIVRDVRKLK